MTRSLLVATLALTLALGPGHAAAQSPTSTPIKPNASKPAAKASATSESKLAVLPLGLTGSQDETAGPRLFEHLQKGLARGAFAVVDAAEVERLAANGCSEKRCLAALRKQAGATFVLRSAITVDDRDYVVRLELLATEDGALLASSEERCDLCGLAEVGALVEAQGALLRRKLEDLIQGPPRLAVVTRPAGALVLVDNELIGKTPLEQNLLDGEHVVRVMLDGYVDDDARSSWSRACARASTSSCVARRRPRATAPSAGRPSSAASRSPPSGSACWRWTAAGSEAAATASTATCSAAAASCSTPTWAARSAWPRAPP